MAQRSERAFPEVLVDALVKEADSPEEAAFIDALARLDKSRDWKMCACAGRTMAVVGRSYGPEMARDAEEHAMAWWHTAEERQAWRFGFDWKPGAEPLPLAWLERKEARS